MTAAPSVPGARAEIAISKDKNGNTRLKMTVQHLANLENLTPRASAYVVWLQERDGNSENQGQLKMDKNLKATFETVTPFKSFDVFVTAEQDARLFQADPPNVDGLPGTLRLLPRGVSTIRQTPNLKYAVITGHGRFSDLLNSADLLYAVRHRLKARTLQSVCGAVIRCSGIHIYVDSTGAACRAGDARRSGCEQKDPSETVGASINARR
jgi:hypothetical protein